MVPNKHKNFLVFNSLVFRKFDDYDKIFLKKNQKNVAYIKNSTDICVVKRYLKSNLTTLNNNLTSQTSKTTQPC